MRVEGTAGRTLVVKVVVISMFVLDTRIFSSFFSCMKKIEAIFLYYDFP